MALLLTTIFLSSPIAAQTSLRLPLPVDSPANSLVFETTSPTASVLSGVLLPSVGPLTAWAPVWSALQADGSLKESQTGGWTGRRPDKWIKAVKPGYVIAGFRALVRVGAAGVQTRQVQIFWRPWRDGGVSGAALTSRVYGLAAAQSDEVRIVEITLPDGAVPTGLYGETVNGNVTQVSLTVKQSPQPEAQTPAASLAPRSATSPTLPQTTGSGPSLPVVPPVVLAKP